MARKLPLYSVYFYSGDILKGVKKVFAENEAMAIMIAKVIAHHDREMWGVNMGYKTVMCGLPIFERATNEQP